MTAPSETKSIAAAPSLSIIIVNYNGGHRVEACLESIVRNPGRRMVEVIVYDNASRDGSGDRIAERFPEGRLIRGSENLGLCRAFNLAAREAQAPYILALDNDTVLLEGAIDAMLDFLEARPDVGAVGSNLYNTDMTLQLAARRFPGALSGMFSRRGILTRLFPRNPVARHDLMADRRDSGEPYEVDWHSAASLMLPRRVYDQIGGFDERFFVYWSDADLCARVRAAGYSVYTVPAARIVHDETLAGHKGPANPRMVIDFHRGAYQFYRTHRLSGALLPLAAPAWLALAVRATVLIGLDQLRWKLRRALAGTPHGGA